MVTKRVGPGEKIRRLRQAMGLTQHDLTSDELSKSIVSMIESNKRNLTWRTANIIAANLTTYYEKLGRKITAEYLMESEEDEARRIIKEDIDHLQKVIIEGKVDQHLLENTYEKILNHIKEWGLKEEQANLKVIMGHYYYDKFQYNKSLKINLDVLDYSLRINNHSLAGQIYNELGNIYQMQMSIDIALIHYAKVYDTAVEYETKYKEKLKVLSVYNQIICYRKIKRYDLALSHINILRDSNWDNPRFKSILNKVQLLEASTYRDLKNYDKATKIYEKLLNNKNELDPETLFLTYDNYAEMFLQQNKPREALVFINNAYYLRQDVNINYLPALYLKEAKCYNLLEDYDLVVTLLENALRLAQQVGKQDIILEMHFAFVDLYLKIKDYETALTYLETTEKIIIEKNIDSHKTDLYNFYCNVYLSLGEPKKVELYLIKMRKKYLVN